MKEAFPLADGGTDQTGMQWVCAEQLEDASRSPGRRVARQEQLHTGVQRSVE